MSWIHKLYETYECCAGREPNGAEALLPICHTTQQAQLEVVLDASGSFKRASVLDKSTATTIIPCTEASGGRSGSKPVNHPLCDKLQYVAGDFLTFGGEVTSGFASNPEEPYKTFVRDLENWIASDCPHPKLIAIHRYIVQKRLIADLVRVGILPIEPSNSRLLKTWGGDKIKSPPIFNVLSNNQVPSDAFVRWRVEEVGNPISATWDDEELISAWINYYQAKQTKCGYCMVSGKETALAEQHPAKLRHSGDKAKLISTNDTSGYTFRGKFLHADEALSVSFEVTQKAHNALRWLITRQGYRNGEQVIVSWAITGQLIPDPFASTLALLPDTSAISDDLPSVDVAQSFAFRLKHAIAGYGARLNPTDDIVVMGLDSATPGRMAIMFYRELKGSDFLARIENWHAKCAWPQNFGKDKRFVGTPAPRDIAEAAYGRWDEKQRKIIIDEKKLKLTVERLLPCIIDEQEIPLDLVLSTCRHATNRISFERSESGYEGQWEKCIGIACALFRGYHSDRSYQMNLEQNRTTRDYLYGRVLAIADSIESYALSLTDEGKKHDTTAARFMQRFAARPFSTWINIELALKPYESRLKAGSEKSAGFLAKRRRLLDEVITMMDKNDDRVSDKPLSGEFLLGFHSQRQQFRESGKAYVDVADDQDASKSTSDQ